MNTLHFCAGSEWLLASASTDTTVCVWDVRKLSAAAPATAARGVPKPLHEFAHSRGTQAAEWAPDGSGRLLSTSFDNCLRVWPAIDPSTGAMVAAAKAAAKAGAKAGSVVPARAIKHDTQTGRWVVPFRATWSSDSSAVVVGGMKRTAELYDAASGLRLASLSDELMTAIPSRNAAHMGGRAIACATNSGRVHVYRA